MAKVRGYFVVLAAAAGIACGQAATPTAPSSVSSQSTGFFIPAIPENSIAVFQDLASDMAAGVEFPRSRPEIDRNRIGLAGVSQAAWIVPIAAAKTQPAFMLLIVGPTVSIGVEHFYSSIVDMRRP